MIKRLERHMKAMYAESDSEVDEDKQQPAQ